MIWRNPWAWMGLSAIAVPIAVHLIARSFSTPLPFPTLRFLRAASVVDVRRRRIHDPALLAVRILIVAAAVAALAQPYITAQGAPAINRIIVVDSSASVSEEAARDAVAQASAGASEVFVIARPDPAGAMREAAAWLAARDGRREAVVISDFQRGAFSRDAMAAFPSTAGVALIQVPMLPAPARTDGDVAWSLAGDTTRAQWRDASQSADGLEIVGASDDTRTIDAIRRAAADTAAAHAGAARRAVLVLPSAPDATAMRASAGTLDAPWMFDVFAAIDDGLGIVAASGTVAREGTAVPAFFLSTDDPARVAAAAQRAIPALSTTPIAELETIVMTPDDVRALERDAAPVPAPMDPSHPASRWFWAAALLLLGVEWLMRRTRATVEGAQARAA